MVFEVCGYFKETNDPEKIQIKFSIGKDESWQAMSMKDSTIKSVQGPSALNVSYSDFKIAAIKDLAFRFRENI